MGKIIVVCNWKGGVGKTTTATALASGLRKKGYKTLLVDADPQRNSTDTYRARSKGVGTLYDLMAEGDLDVVQKTELGDIIAGDELLCDAEKVIRGAGAHYRLKSSLQPFKSQYDYILIDTSPALGLLLINALTAADSCIVPMEAARYSLQATNDLTKNIADVKAFTNPDLVVEGILLIKYSGRKKAERAVEDGLSQYAEKLGTKIFETKIRETTAVPQSQLARMGLFEYAPKCTAAVDYMRLIEEVLKNG